MAVFITTFPKFVVFQKQPPGSMSGKYLRYATEGARQGSIQLNADVVVSSFTKFEIEAANTGNGEMIHIKSCYNNKYLARVSSSNNISACEDRPEENLTNRSCTLFRLDVNGRGNNFNLFHVQSNFYARHDPQHHGLYLSIGRTDVYAALDWEDLTILPRLVVFKSVEDGRYLGVRVRSRKNFLMLTGYDEGHPDVVQEVISDGGFNVAIKSVSFDRFWRNSGKNDILVDSNTANWFRPVKVGPDTVAMRSLSSSLFVAEDEENPNFMSILRKSPAKDAILQVEESFVRRSIYNIHYHLDEATVYNVTPMVLVTTEASNASTEVESITVRLTYTDETKRSFNNSISVGLSSKTKISTGFAIIVDGEIEIETSAKYQYSWGETVTISQQGSRTVNINVAPGTRVRASVVATSGMCHIPFSYTQSDHLSNGQIIYTNKDDGVYVGANFYNIHTDTQQEPLELVRV